MHSPHRWVGIARWLATIAFASLVNAPANSQTLVDVATATTVPRWDCWISLEWRPAAIYSIRCIHDRDVPPPEPAPDPATAALLDYVHERIHRGETQQLDADVAAGRLAELYGHIWNVRIYQYPYEESWRDRRPELLVQGTLCAGTPACQVMITH